MISKLEIFDRAIVEGSYIADKKVTVRQASKVFKISKSTIYSDVTEALPQVDGPLSEKVREVLAENKALRHIRGGLAMKNKYRK